MRITAQLIDATAGHHLWADRYDRDLKDILALQDEITIKVVTALRIKLTEGEQARVFAKQYKNLDTLLKFLEARSLWEEGTEESHVRFERVAQELIDMAPDSALGYRLLAWAYWRHAMIGNSPRESVGKAFNLAEKALDIDDSDSMTYALLGSIYLMMRKYEEAIAAGERSVALDPNGSMAHGLLGMTLSYAGKPDEAIIRLNRSIRLNPFSPYWPFLRLGQSYLQKGRYEEALAAYKKALKGAPDATVNHLHLAIVYVLLNRQEEARAAVKKVLETNPDFTVKRLFTASPFKNQADIKLFADALLRAGLPE